MADRLLLILLVVCFNAVGQEKGMVEQIYQRSVDGALTVSHIVQAQTKQGWGAELRYNYEEEKTFSFYVEKIYQRNGKLSYAFTPMAGGVVGNYKGGAAGFKLDLSWRKVWIASQSQYIVSTDKEQPDLYFTWSELGFDIRHFLFTGVAAQTTHFFEVGDNEILPGVLVGGSYKNLMVTFYSFKANLEPPSYTASIIWTWKKKKQ